MAKRASCSAALAMKPLSPVCRVSQVGCVGMLGCAIPFLQYSVCLKEDVGPFKSLFYSTRLGAGRTEVACFYPGLRII